MTSKHPHYDTIVAWAEGKTIQVWCNVGRYWYDWSKDDCAPAFFHDNMYRVKPETIRYRNYLRKAYFDKELHYVEIVSEADNKEDPREEWSQFVRWLGDWQEVEC